MNDLVSILFADGHQGAPDYRLGSGGPSQPDRENMVVFLHQDEWLEYNVNLPQAGTFGAGLKLDGPGDWELSCSGQQVRFHAEGGEHPNILKLYLEPGKYRLRVICRSKSAKVDEILLGV
jgi:hypothetical protein